MIPTLIGITFLVFMIVALAPGGIGASLKVEGGQMQSQTSVAVQQAYLEDRYGLDDPPVVQYIRWLGRISPLKLGTREQVSLSGERVRPPKAIREPPLWTWFTPALPPVPVFAPAPPPTDQEQKVARFKAGERRYAEARAQYVAATVRLREALGEYAKAKNIAGGWDAKGQGRERVLAGTTPDKAAAAWGPLQAQAEVALTAYAQAQAARAELADAFAAKPYAEAGYWIIPGFLSISSPDFGVAYSRQRPVMDLIAAALPVTLLLNLIAFPIIYMVAIPAGMLAAIRRGSWLDGGLGAFFISLWSIPAVLAGVLCIGFLASNEYLGAFPVSGLHANDSGAMAFLPHRLADGAPGRGGWAPGYLLDLVWHVALPVLCLVYSGFAILSKQTRTAMLENFNADYVRTAKAKGVAPRDIILRHVFRNSLLPLITLFVTIFPAMLAGSVVVEKIFTIPGMGSLILQAIDLRDRELLLADTLMIAGTNLVALLLADILYAMADPRVTYD